MNEEMMTTELVYLAAVALFTAFLWIPYVLNAFAVRGIMATMGNPSADAKPLSPWASRLKAAHANALENLVVFAALVLTAHALGVTNEVTAWAAVIYFWARVAHYVIYGLGIPVLRTLAFAVGWFCQLAIAQQILF